MNQNVFKILQIEHADAVRDIDEILEIPGVDAIVVGQNDLSGSVGKLTRIMDPDIQQMMKTQSAERSGTSHCTMT